jgi:hypothetical protein
MPRAASQFGFLETLDEEFPNAGSADIVLVIRSDGESNAQDVGAAWGESLAGDPRVETVCEGTAVGDYATLPSPRCRMTGWPWSNWRATRRRRVPA